ncbi:hypothetical protein E4U14_000594 [Claviceps sp. LM454 group G7]|nr:hypothetical protein E4U14_000594 [Claviceps sp. LM454 group G7]
MRMGEFTDLAVEVECDDFVHTKLTTRCLTISPDGDHLQLFLPRSKADNDNLGVSISMTATGDLACPVRNARLLLSTRPSARPADPLFELHWGGFQREDVLTALRNRLTLIGEPTTRLTGYSFRRGVAQHAYDWGLSRADIQRLGRRTSDAVDRHFTKDNSRI